MSDFILFLLLWLLCWPARSTVSRSWWLHGWSSCVRGQCQVSCTGTAAQYRRDLAMGLEQRSLSGEAWCVATGKFSQQHHFRCSTPGDSRRTYARVQGSPVADEAYFVSLGFNVRFTSANFLVFLAFPILPQRCQASRGCYRRQDESAARFRHAVSM
jgi:hypothetical protein